MKIDLLDKELLSWQDYGPDDRFSFPIGYGGALLGHDGQGHIDLLYRWEPGKYCHFHRHLCEVRSTVLQGSLEVVTFEEGVEVSKVNPPGWQLLTHARGRCAHGTWWSRGRDRAV